MLWELFAADIESVESIGGICAVFEEVFLGLWLLFHGLVLSEAIAPAFDTSLPLTPHPITTPSMAAN